eukprot:scaffold59513_cov50-Attheya_sp.AAC.1
MLHTIFIKLCIDGGTSNPETEQSIPYSIAKSLLCRFLGFTGPLNPCLCLGDSQTLNCGHSARRPARGTSMSGLARGSKNAGGRGGR